MYRQLNRELDNWIISHRKYEEALKEIKQRSFCGRNLNQPGTMVEIDDAAIVVALMVLGSCLLTMMNEHASTVMVTLLRSFKTPLPY